MVWGSFGFHSRKKLIDYLLNNLKNNDQEIIQHASTNFGKHFWVAIKDKQNSFIILYLLQVIGGDWGYKGISEEMGPSYFDCPKKLLDKTVGVVVSEYSDSWRNKMGELKRKSKIKYNVGDTVEAFAMTVKIIAKIKRSYKIEVIDVRDQHHFKKGSIYRATAKDITPLTQSIDYILNA